MKYRTVAFAAAALLLAAPRPTAANEQISCSPTAPNKTVCRIVEPDVKHPNEPLPQVTYKPGDDVIVDAGGCVQTGGFGKTWKRYVNPAGPNTEKLYHGLINVPGASNGLERIGHNHRVFHVSPKIQPSKAFVRLGYEDDNYKDNGYWGHDDGDDDQCKNSVNAFVTITIVHNPVVNPKPVALKPLDPVSKGFDDNGLMFAPTWAYESGGLIKSVNDICPNGDPKKCTRQSIGFDGASFPKTPGWCNGSGHFNWSNATFVGKIFWQDHSWSDDDYDFWLVGATSQFSEPLTSDNDAPPGQFVGTHLEFDSDETVDVWTSDWWNGFHKAVDDSDEKARAKIDDADAVVFGLLGLDCVHDCGTEIHPVLAMAIRVNDHPANIDRWSFFARNEGDEGFCSENLHHLGASTLAMRLHPPSPSMHHFQLVGSNMMRNNKNVTFEVDRDGSDAILLITIPDNQDEAHLSGSIDLQWTS
jgi:hypothetical protein